MLRKKEVYSVVTPIPGFIPRQLALDILHSHSEVITLNPLVLSHKAIPAPRDAAADEFYSTWYEITERVQVVPGAGKFGSSKITFNGCFHDMPWGLQTHTYAPFNIDLRIKYRIAGNQPGIEPPEIREMGLESLGAPQDGLYLREDIEIRCNITMVGFVKAQLKTASKEMVQRIIRKAELLDAGVLQAMMSQDGRLRTINPNDRSDASAAAMAGRPLSPSRPPSSFGGSPRPMGAYPASPTLSTAPGRSNTSASWRDYRNSYQGYPNQQQQQHQQQQHQQQMYNPMTTPPPIPPKEQQSSPQPMELPGDFQYHQPPPQQQQQQHPSPALHPSHAGFAPHHWPASHHDASNNTSPNPQWGGPQPSPTSTSSAYGGSSTGGQPSPNYPGAWSQQSHITELPSNSQGGQWR